MATENPVDHWKPCSKCILNWPPVAKFLARLSGELRPRVDDEFATMFNMKKHVNPLAKRLEVWDVPYYANRVSGASMS